MTKKVITTFLTCLLLFNTLLFSQDRPKTILWEISKKGLSHKSYLMGTNHSFNETWIDSFTVIKEKLLGAKTILTELSMDNLSALYPKHTPFNKLFGPEEYKLVDNYLKSKGLSTLDDAPNDLSSLLALFEVTYRRLMQPGEKANKVAIDAYIERVGIEKNAIVYLDSGAPARTDSVATLNEKFLASSILWAIRNETNEDAVTSLLNEGKPMLDEFRELTVDYKLNENNPNIDELETKELILKRNAFWLTKLPQLLKANSCFIAVGLLHLKYKEGLISQLRAMGFTVVPVAITRKHSS